jgi:class 3 adenylate cyclase/tetratricopeptide (TPR) repeat protein
VAHPTTAELLADALPLASDERAALLAAVRRGVGKAPPVSLGAIAAGERQAPPAHMEPGILADGGALEHAANAVSALPSGTVTFLFTDIEGSTRLLQQLGAERYATLQAEHHRLLRAAFQEYGGREVDTQGDSFFVAFPTATGAVAAAAQAQRAFAAHPWPDGTPVHVRMGLHAGAPLVTGGGYVGLDVVRAARIAAAGHGGQILLSEAARGLVEHELPDGATLRDMGTHRLKDLQHAERLSQLVLPGLAADFPPLKSLDVGPHKLPAQQAAPPTVQTFLVADMRDYMRYTQEHGDEAAARLAAKFAALVRERVEAAGGRVLDLAGDAALVVFDSPRRALRTAVALQAAFAAAWQTDLTTPLLVGIGLDAGEAIAVEGGFRGGAPNLAAQLCNAAAPGEVFASETVIGLARKIEGLVYVPQEPRQLKGFSGPVRMVQVLPADAAGGPGQKRPSPGKEATASPTVTDAPAPAAAVSPAPGDTQPLDSQPRLVDRVPQLALIGRLLAGEAPPVLLLAGEPGIGKSRLLRETAIRARATGWTVVRGGCQKRSRHEPYAPLPGALVRHLGERAPAQKRADLQGCEWLARLLPELVQTSDLPLPQLPQWTPTPEQERRLMFDAAARFLTNVAGTAGTLLVLDDLQWAGTDALDLLDALIRAPAGAPLRVVGAYRDSEVGDQDPLAVLLVDLVREGQATQVELRPLPAHEATELLDELLEGIAIDRAAVAEKLVRRGSGVPFFLVSYAHGLRSGALDASVSSAVPWDVAQTIRQRVAALPESARELLGAAAVVGRQAALAPITAVAQKLGQDELAVLTGLELACQARLLAEEGDAAYRFTHDLIRDVIVSGLGAARRAMLHRRVAEALEQEHGEPAADVLAYHYLQAGNAEKAVVYLERAGDRAVAMQAHVSAEGFYRELIERLDGLGRRMEAAQAREKLGVLLKNLARYHEALEVLERAADAYRTEGDLDGWARATTQIGASYMRSGRPDEGQRRLQEALKQPGARQVLPEQLAGIQIVLAQIYMATDRYGEELQAAERAAEYARAAQDMQHLTWAQNHRGWALLMLSRTEEAVGALEEALRLAEAAGNLNGLSYALNELAGVHAARGELTQHRTYSKRALEVAEQLGDPLALALMESNQGDLAYVAGEWIQARREYERAMAAVDRADTTVHSPYPLFGFGRLAQAEGRWEEASRYLRETISLAEASGNVEALRIAHAELAERDLLEERATEAYSRLEPLLDRPGQQEIQVTAFLPLLAWAHAERGEADEAAALLAESIARATAAHMQPALTLARRVEGMLAARRGRWQEAERVLTEALSLAREIRYPYAEAKSLYWLGMLYTWKGEPPSARQRLEAALTILRGLGERLYAERVEQALAALEGH